MCAPIPVPGSSFIPGRVAPQNGRVPNGAAPHAPGGDRQLHIAAALHRLVAGAADSSAVSSGSGGSEESRAACSAYVDAVQRLLESNVAYVAEVRQVQPIPRVTARCSDSPDGLRPK